MKPSQRPTEDEWYCRSPIGHNTLKGVLRTICERAGFADCSRFSNHYLRRTAAPRLYQAHVDEQLTAEVTGHSSNAIRQYKVTSDKQKAADRERCSSGNTQRRKHTWHAVTGLHPRSGYIMILPLSHYQSVECKRLRIYSLATSPAEVADHCG